jgi:hypothetical protein
VTGLGWLSISRVESSPVRLTKTLQTLFGICIVAAHGNAYTLAELSQVPRILPSQESRCCMSHFCQLDSSDQRDSCYFVLGNKCRKDYFSN